MKSLITIFISILLVLPCSSQQVLLLAFSNELSSSGGIVYFKGTPFTGKLIEEKTNRELGEFKDGYKNGLFTKYYPDGKKMTQGKYILGKKEGPHTSWYENGNKKDEITYDNGVLNGTSSEWYSNGKIKSSGGYILGRKDGLHTSWYENGNKEGEKTYVNNELNGPSSEWYLNGKIKSSGGYILGRKGGLHTSWYENGNKKDEITYDNGVLNGRSSEWYSNGQIKVECRYNSGQIVDGKYTIYLENGQKEKEETYSKGIKCNEGIYKDGFLYEQSILYYVNGRKKTEGTLKNGLRDGIWTEWYKTGEKKKEEKYESENRVSLIFEETKLITDIDDNAYHTTTIGNQVWMIENLKTTKYRNGDLIETTIPVTLNIDGYETPKYQWSFNGDENIADTYGRLYTWYAATDSRNVCPTGWHVPSDAEWTKLTKFLGGEYVAGGKLKVTGTNYWLPPNTGATNSSGFSALPSGLRDAKNQFFSISRKINSCGYWWSSTESLSFSAYVRAMYSEDSTVVYRSTAHKSTGESVRCIKD